MSALFRTILIRGMCLVLALTGTSMPAAATRQTPPPRALEFEVGDVRDVVSYHVEVFRRGDDISRVRPVKTLDIPAPSTNSPTVRIQLEELGSGLPSGEYVLTISAATKAGRSARSAPSAPFIIQGSAPSADAGTRATPRQQPDPPDEPAEKDHSKLALLIGIVIGAAALLVPLLK